MSGAMRPVADLAFTQVLGIAIRSCCTAVWSYNAGGQNLSGRTLLLLSPKLLYSVVYRANLDVERYDRDFGCVLSI